MEKIRQFIEELQHSEEKRKKRWVWILSLSSFTVVVFIWGIYTRYTIYPSLFSDDSQPGFLATTRQGATVAYNLIKENVSREKFFEIQGVGGFYNYLPPQVSPLSPTEFPLE